MFFKSLAFGVYIRRLYLEQAIWSRLLGSLFDSKELA